MSEIIKKAMDKITEENRQRVKEHTEDLTLLDVSPSLLSEIVGLNQTYSLKHILQELVKASEILLHEKDYDGHGWEIIAKCTDLAKEKIQLLSNEG